MASSSNSRSTRTPPGRGTTDSMPLRPHLERCRERIERTLESVLPGADAPPAELHEAMRYATLSNGKYIRPLLVYSAGLACGVDDERLDAPACAVELIHAYSLIHDDLPAMDDDDLRRGRPTCHRVYGEAMAILAGDALQALAFHVLVHGHGHGLRPEGAAPASAERRLRMVSTLALACGSLGMVGGQAIDLLATGSRPTIGELEGMHTRKTGALIQASVLLGALSGASDRDEERLQRLGGYGRCIGLAFQVRDDILDVEGDTETLGKQAGADEALDKPTYPSLLGLDGARAKARELHAQALDHLRDFGSEADPLRAIADLIVERRH